MILFYRFDRLQKFSLIWKSYQKKSTSRKLKAGKFQGIADIITWQDSRIRACVEFKAVIMFMLMCVFCFLSVVAVQTAGDDR